MTKMERYMVKVQGPKELHDVLVFAGDHDDAAAAAIDKLKDKIIRHEFKGWGPVDGPWKVLSATVC